MTEEMPGLWLRWTEHITGYLWHKYTITGKQVVIATVKL